MSVTFALLAAGAPAAQAAPDTGVTAFVHVNVVPMDRERVLRDRTVLVSGGRIRAVGSAADVPAGARVIDGRGTAYLLPGLADMHTHSDTRSDLAVYLANGVTTILNMGDARYGFIARTMPAANRGEIPAPHVYAAFVVDGSPRFGHFVVATPDEARAVVRLARTNGYHFIKVYNDLSPDVFRALVSEGRARGVPVVGHGVTRVGLEEQLAAGQRLVAHAEEFFYTVFTKPNAAPPDTAPDVRAIPRVAAAVARSGAFVTADLNTYATIAGLWGRPDVLARSLRMPETRYLAPGDRIAWQGAGYVRRGGSIAGRLAFLSTFTRALSDAGVPLVTGTDAPTIPGLVPGFSLHEDLAALERAGLSRFQVLAAATRTPGELIATSLPGSTPFGIVAAGNRADLILVAGDPLADLSVLRAPLGVMSHGRWYPASTLRALLGDVAATYERAVPPADSGRAP
ncbi:MAG TPA: amidohydrolase family protein [Gemmatimonadaceae bacterium]|nr:amidohydrolase family protein [Gemmatimonadaceae bacterium]